MHDLCPPACAGNRLVEYLNGAEPVTLEFGEIPGSKPP